MTGRPRSLKSRALQLLAQREQSCVELRRKLMVHAASDMAAWQEAETAGDGQGAGAGTFRALNAQAQADLDSTVDRETMSEGAAARVDAVLAWLETNSFLSDQRFAESRVHARASRYGNLRIRQELKQHGVELPEDTARALQESESSRALGVWERRFGQAPQTAAESAKQSRFLTARGFSPEVVRHILRARRTRAGASEGAEAESIEAAADAD